MALNWAGLRAQEVLREYMDSNMDAKLHKEEEYNATVKIQVAYRRHRAIQMVRLWHKMAIEIQRCYRGHLGRETFHFRRRQRDHELRMAYFNKHAIHIQRIFRGYWSRKFISDFYARKAFIMACVLAGKRLRTLCMMNYKLQIRDEQQDALKSVNAEIDRFFNENHHRVSTEVRKGAFYSPFVAIFGGGRSYLEEHIRDARRREVTGMELEKLDGYNEDGIPVKQLQNTYFVKSSKIPHSKMSLDTQKRILVASQKATSTGTYITRQGQYETRYEHRRKQEAKSYYLVPHEKEFSELVKRDKAWWINMSPTLRASKHYHILDVIRKEETLKELRTYPNMVEHPWSAHVPNGFLFETYLPFDKIFPKLQNHHHWPKYSLNRSMHGSFLPRI